MTITLRELAEQARIYSSKEIRDSTFDNWNKALRLDIPVPIAKTPVEEIDFYKVREFRIKNLQKNGGPWSSNTMYTRLNSLTSIYKIAIEERLLPLGTENVFKGQAKKHSPGRLPKPGSSTSSIIMTRYLIFFGITV